MSCRIEFIGSNKTAVDLKDGDNLSEKLNIHNSPILFGCRIGICGTCAIEIVEEDGPSLHPRTHDEVGFLEAIAPGQDKVRLACQIHINTNLKVKKIEL
jgi:ferredoxin